MNYLDGLMILHALEIVALILVAANIAREQNKLRKIMKALKKI